MLTAHLALLKPPTGSDAASQLEGGEEASQGQSDGLGLETWPWAASWDLAGSF